MLSLIILLFLKVSTGEYEKISKYSSASVKPDTKVYLDISSFKVGESIKLEFIMDLFFGSYSRYSYSFSIGQSHSNTYSDTYYWDHLHSNTTTDVSCTSSYKCTFKWTEKKEAGAYFIYIIPPAPFPSFYKTWKNKIKVSHTGGLSAGAIAGIVIGSVAGAVILIVIIYYCCCRNKPQPVYTPSNPTVTMTYTQPIVQTVVTPVQPVIQPVIQPVVPTYGPPPPQPYYPPTAVY